MFGSRLYAFHMKLLSCYLWSEVSALPRKQITDKLSIYIPDSKKELDLVERLIALGEKRDRSVNYLVVQAIAEFLEREE